MAYQIIGIRKDDQAQYGGSQGISHYMWRSPEAKEGLTNREAMVDWLKKPDTSCYVSNGTDPVWCEVRSNGHIEFLQTVSDGQATNNLLSLPLV